MQNFYAKQKQSGKKGANEMKPKQTCGNCKHFEKPIGHNQIGICSCIANGLYNGFHMKGEVWRGSICGIEPSRWQTRELTTTKCTSVSQGAKNENKDNDMLALQ